MVTPPLPPGELLARYPHAIEGVVIHVDERPGPAMDGVVMADVAVTMGVGRVRQGPLRTGDVIVFHGEAILRNDDFVVGISGTVPASLAPGQVVAVVLASHRERLVVPHHSALALIDRGHRHRPWSSGQRERQIMGDYLHLLIGNADRLSRLTTEHGEATRVFLPTGGGALGIAPATLAMVDNVGDWYGPLATTTGARELPQVDIAFGERFTAGGGALAYVEVEEQAGFGHRAAALWRDGALVFGLEVDAAPPVPFVPPPAPRLIDRLLGRRPVSPPPPRRPDPIARALAGLAQTDAVGTAAVQRGMMALRKNADLPLHWIERPPPG